MNYIRNHTLNQSEKSTLYHRYVLSTMVSFTFSTSNHSRSSYIISAGNSKPREYQIVLYCKWMWCFSQDQRANELNLTVMRNISGRIQSESLVDGLHPTRYAIHTQVCWWNRELTLIQYHEGSDIPTAGWQEKYINHSIGYKRAIITSGKCCVPCIGIRCSDMGIHIFFVIAFPGKITACEVSGPTIPVVQHFLQVCIAVKDVCHIIAGRRGVLLGFQTMPSGRISLLQII